ncbi:hypothetical protein SNEBB_006135 [Seison nebaliae]|nr:hypothetical protein SNEBB_006135 [Seison nebaliae]
MFNTLEQFVTQIRNIRIIDTRSIRFIHGLYKLKIFMERFKKEDVFLRLRNDIGDNRQRLDYHLVTQLNKITVKFNRFIDHCYSKTPVREEVLKREIAEIKLKMNEYNLGSLRRRLGSNELLFQIQLLYHLLRFILLKLNICYILIGCHQDLKDLVRYNWERNYGLIQKNFSRFVKTQEALNLYKCITINLCKPWLMHEEHIQHAIRYEQRSELSCDPGNCKAETTDRMKRNDEMVKKVVSETLESLVDQVCTEFYGKRTIKAVGNKKVRTLRMLSY